MLAVVDQRKSVALQQIGWQQVLALVSAKWPHALQAQFSSMLEVVLPLLLGMAVVSVGQPGTDVAMVSGQILVLPIIFMRQGKPTTGGILSPSFNTLSCLLQLVFTVRGDHVEVGAMRDFPNGGTSSVLPRHAFKAMNLCLPVHEARPSHVYSLTTRQITRMEKFQIDTRFTR